MHYHWEQTATKKWNMATLKRAHQAKKQCSVTLTVVRQNNSRAVYIASYESCEPKRFSRCCNKVERKYIQEKQPNQIYCCIQNMGFVNRMDQSMANYRIVIQMKKYCWSPFVGMVDVVLQGARVLYRINKDVGDESPTFLVF